MNKDTAARLYDYRRANHFSQEELAERIGVSRQAISKWERGESSPDTDNLIALAKLYGITIDELINGTEIPKETVFNNESNQENNEFIYDDVPEDTDKSSTFGSGINYNDGKDHVHIGFDGIHIETKNDSVHIGADDIGKRGKDFVEKNPFLHAVMPLICITLYLILGFTVPMGWAAGWLLFLLIPIAESLYSAIKTKNPSAFAYPVLMVFLYLGLGFAFHIWHPTWILFVTIPVYYVMCDSIKKANAEKRSAEGHNANSTAGTYYSPNIDETKPHRKSSIPAIIMTIICSLTVISVVAISCVFGFLNRLDIGGIASDISSVFTDSDYYDYNEAYYTAGGAEIDAELIQNIDIDWISGNVNIEYYDGATVSLSEAHQNDDKYNLRYRVNNGTLDIKYMKSGSYRHKNIGLSKELTILIPQGKAINNIDIESISASVNSDVTVNNFDVETVSGNIYAGEIMNSADAESVSGNITISCPKSFNEISTDSVSGETEIRLPQNINGFYITASSVSGRVNASDFGIGGKASDYSYGSGSSEISFNSVSGNLNIKAE